MHTFTLVTNTIGTHAIKTHPDHAQKVSREYTLPRHGVDIHVTQA